MSPLVWISLGLVIVMILVPMVADRWLDWYRAHPPISGWGTCPKCWSGARSWGGTRFDPVVCGDCGRILAPAVQSRKSV